MENKLFAGHPFMLGGLSNERELIKECPGEFRKHYNKWCEAASKLFFGGGSICHWSWKTKDENEKKKQLSCFKSLLGSFDIKHEDKEAVAGWMLSEMLT